MTTTNVRFHALVQTTTALNTDRYIGRIGYDSTKARWVVSPDGATWAESARRDVAETFAVSITSPAIVASTSLRIAALNGLLAQTSGGNVRTATASDLPSHASRHENGGADPLTGANIAGLRVSDSPEWAGASLNGNLWLKASGNRVWSMLGSATSFDLASRNADGSAIDWPITIGHGAGEAIVIGGSTSRPVNVKHSIQLNGVDTITATREGRFTGLRLTNLSAGKIPVASDANGQITASGLTDDGAYFSSTRTLRLWNFLTRSGLTWSAFQWTQSSDERVSILSSDAGGVGGYHTVVLAPADTNIADRCLGGINYAQKTPGTFTGTNPGLKIVMSGRSAGAGGSTGGYGGQWRLEYRPDNGANLANALRVGCFGGGVADAVQADILLRANADFLATYAKIQKDSSNSVGLDVVGPSGTGKFRMVNTGAGSELGVSSGTLEILCANGVAIGVPGGSSILITSADTSISNLWTSGVTKRQFFERTGSGATPANETLIVYTGSSNATESLPSATGSKRIIEFSHCGTGDWTIDADGTDLILDGGSSGVGSVTILPTNTTRSRKYFDFQPGKWARL